MCCVLENKCYGTVTTVMLYRLMCDKKFHYLSRKIIISVFYQKSVKFTSLIMNLHYA